MPDPDYKALCKELADALAEQDHCWMLINDARAALEAQPEPQGPTVIGPEWQPCVKLPITVHVREQRPGETHSSTREGITPLRPDDLIMRGVRGEEYPIGRELFNQTYRMGAALAQPERVPTDEEIEEWHDQCADLTRLGEVDHYWAFDLRSDEVAGVVRAALARWGRPTPQPPADGEVAELVEWLLREADYQEITVKRATCADRIRRAACLLEHPTPQPPAELAEMVKRLHEINSPTPQPEPVAPTDEDVTELFYRHMGEGSEVGFENAIAEALARWGNSQGILDSSPQPVWANIHYVWELEDADGEWQAGGSANSLEDVQREGNRYLQTYAQDGPHKLIIQRHCVNTIEEVTNG